ncbi:hypothetical protein JXO59_02540 [candidate division KSB1 bacterium]|nr:hypothetical protein [candidate division KSB1 bacterium]
MRRRAIQILCMLFLGGAFYCNYDKMPLPSPKTPATSFGANDTSYVELNPIWDQSILGAALNAPGDIIMGPDGVIFLANTGNDQILALSRAGHLLTDHGLGGIGPLPHPNGLAMDSKLDLLIVNGGHTIYCWNQYLNFVTIDSVAVVGVYFDSAGKDTVHLSFQQLNDRRQQQDIPIPELLYYIFEKNDETAEAAQKLYVFYEHDDQTASFNGVAAGKYGSEWIYATDLALDKIIRLQYAADMAIKTTDGQICLRYIGIYNKDIANYGSGSGTVDDPWTIITDRDENIYFTQLGGNFKVQKLAAQTYIPKYVLYQHDIMDLGRFVAPYDVALDDAENIFVLDTGVGSVFKFANSGSIAGELLPLGSKGLAVARFKDAKGIMAQDQIVYVVESGENCIRRFQYSVSDADLPDDNKTP